MISDQALMTTHVETLFTHDVFSRLQFVNEPWADNTVSIPAPRFFLGRTATGNVWRFRSDVPLTLVEQLEELCANEPVMLPLQKFPKYFEEYMRLLEGHQPSQHVWSGPAYHLANPPRLSPSWIPITAANAESLGAGFEKIRTELETAQPFVGIVEDGCVVSICRSVRIAPRGHEAGVETLKEFRGKGYATAVTAGWVQAVKEKGWLPLYSTSWENRASQEVARKLRAVRYGIDFHIT